MKVKVFVLLVLLALMVSLAFARDVSEKQNKAAYQKEETESEVEPMYYGGGRWGGGWPGGGGGWPGGGGGWPGGGGGWPGGGGGWGGGRGWPCRWYCGGRCCTSAAEAKAFLESELETHN